uniref:Uncharacterized protein n=1 Tax=Mesocestoides corti TaxID=53468 RepID=A0A5K3FZB9_MESCO
MACEKDKQSTREGHDRGAAYNERRGQRGGLGWKVPDPVLLYQSFSYKGSGILHLICERTS